MAKTRKVLEKKSIRHGLLVKTGDPVRDRDNKKLWRSLFYKKHKEKIIAKVRAYAKLNKEKISRNDKRRYKENRAEIRLKQSIARKNNAIHFRSRENAWRLRNSESVRERSRLYYHKRKKLDEKWYPETRKRYEQNNKEKIRTAKRIYEKAYRAKPEIIIKGRLSQRVRAALKSQGVVKSTRTEQLLGCSIDFFRKYILDRLPSGASLRDVHLDHVRPCASFDLTNEFQQKECFHYTNLRPVMPEDNLKKNSTWKGKHYRYGVEA